MSAWTKDIASSPRQARKARTDAIIANMPAPKYPNAERPVPRWLVEEQEKLRRMGTAPRSRMAARANRASSSTVPEPVNSGPTQDEDFIMVDMLDGAHMPTQSPPTQMFGMSPNSDSIISLPPVDHSAAPDTWHELRKADPKGGRRSRHRVTNSIGSSFAEQIQAMSSATPSQPSYRSPSTNTDRPFYRSTRPPDALNEHPEKRQQDLNMLEDTKPAPPTSRKPPVAGSTQLPKISSTPSFKALEIAASLQASPAHPPPAVPKSDNFMPTRPIMTSHGREFDPETRTLLQPDVTTPLHPSRSVHGRMGSYNWFDEETNSYAPTMTSSRRSIRNRRDHFRSGRHEFRPNEWSWRRPAEQDSVMPNSAWIYLPLIGIVTFIIAFLVNSISGFIANGIFDPLSNVCGRILGPAANTIVLALLRGLSLAASFLIILRMSPHYGAGSGIPEMKCVLGGVLMPQMLNWQTLVGKMTGLVFSLASGISIGRLGPFIHMSCISAALVSRLSIFPELCKNTRFQMQALSAAMAAGVGATFGAPIGGTLLAIEIMSTYYYIHWIPMAMYCSIMGYYFLQAITKNSMAYFSAASSIDLQIESMYHLLPYIALGLACGAIGASLVHCSKTLFNFRRQFFKNAVPLRTCGMLVAFAALHSFLTGYLGGVLSLSQRSGVDDLFQNETANSKTWLPGAIQIFGLERINSAVALTVVMVVKFVLTSLSIVMPVPAGVFMPIFQLGALFGRAFGEGFGAIKMFRWLDPQATAIVGAAAMTAGSLHIVSVAVVMMELTREAVGVLPLTVGVIVSYGLSKHLCSDLFSELIRIRKLPYILGLRERYPWENRHFYEDVSSEEAGSFMNKSFPYVTPMTTRGEIWEMLNKGGKPWISCAFLSDRDRRHLWGTVTQQTLWDVLKEDMRDGDEPEYGTFNASESGVMRGLQTVDFLRNFDPDVGDPRVDMGPMQVSMHTPFWKILTFFRMLSMTQMYVLQDGKTVGCLSKADVIKHSIHLEERSQRKRRLQMAAAARAQANSARHGVRASTGNMPVPAAFARARRVGAKHGRQASLGRLPPSKGGK